MRRLAKNISSAIRPEACASTAARGGSVAGGGATAEHNSPARSGSAGHSASAISAIVDVVCLLKLQLELLTEIAHSSALWLTGGTRRKVPDLCLQGLATLGTWRLLHGDPS